MLSLHRWQSSSPRAVVWHSFSVFVPDTWNWRVVVGRIGGYNRGESVQEDADLKTAVAGENLWDDYGIFSFSFFFFFPFFSPICPWSFFSRGLRTGDRQSAASCIASPCRAKTSSDDSQDYHRNYSKMFEAVDYLSRAYSTGTQWPKKKSTSYRSCLFYFFSKKNPGILVEFLFLEQRCKRGKVYKICEGIYVESNDILNFKSDYKYPTPRWNWG